MTILTQRQQRPSLTWIQQQTWNVSWYSQVSQPLTTPWLTCLNTSRWRLYAIANWSKTCPSTLHKLQDIIYYHEWMSFLMKKDGCSRQCASSSSCHKELQRCGTIYWSAGSYIPVAETVRSFEILDSKYIPLARRCLPWCRFYRSVISSWKMGFKRWSMAQLILSDRDTDGLVYDHHAFISVRTLDGEWGSCHDMRNMIAVLAVDK